MNEKMRIIQEQVPGKQITLAHIIANPDEIRNWGWIPLWTTPVPLSALSP